MRKYTGYPNFVIFAVLSALFVFSCCSSQEKAGNLNKPQDSCQVIVGAARIGQYLPVLEGKRVGIVANHTSRVGATHLVDSLLDLGVGVVKIFSPEHGFRGSADAGQYLGHSTDEKTGLPIVSLYGKYYKPSAVDMQDVDVVLFDIQDVGVRFYTYLSTMHYVMEACAENGVKMIVLDRPNPNGHYVDGPVLQHQYQSFVGLHPVPIVHGLTLGEFATMINGEYWLHDSLQCDLEIIPCDCYDHDYRYDVPIPPSPNLKNNRAISLYPSLGIFEGTMISVGRGTGFPFETYGHPDFLVKDFSFTPESTTGSKNPRYKGEKCYGRDLRQLPDTMINGMSLTFLMDAYRNIQAKNNFFNPFFYNLVGNAELKTLMEEGVSAAKIMESWHEDLETYMKVREKYLLYKDFEPGKQ